MSDVWRGVAAVLPFAKAIAFDGCHKIYVLMDEGQVEQMREYGYGEDDSELVPVKDPEAALATVQDWFDGSCALRFVEAVRTVDGDANYGFTNLIAQFEVPHEDDELLASLEDGEGESW